MELKGSKTEENLLAAFAGESEARISILIMLQKQEKKDMFRLPIFLKKLQQMKKSMQKYGLNY